MDNNELEDAIYRKPLSETQTLDAGNGLIPVPWIGNDKEPNGKPAQPCDQVKAGDEITLAQAHNHKCANCGDTLECDGNCEQFMADIASECRALEVFNNE